MNFATLKAGFLRYLKEEGIILSAKEKQELTSASIFAYQDEFREYLNKEHNIDLSELSFEFSDLENFNVENGKISSLNSVDENLTMDIFNEMLEDDEFIGFLDGDSDKKLSDEEIQHFLKFASSDDGNENNLSFDDLLKGYEKAKEGEYDKSELTKAQETSSKASKSSNNYGSYGNQGGLIDKDSADDNSIENMKDEDLKNAQTQKQTDIDNQRAQLNQVYANDAQATDEAKSAYDEAISKDNIAPELKASRDENIKAIDTQDKLIVSLKTTLNDLDGQISSKETELNSILSQKQALNEAMSAIENLKLPNQETNTGALQTLSNTQNTLSVDVQNDITTKKAGIENDLAVVEQNEARLTQEIADLKAQKASKETELNTAQNNLAIFEEQKTTIDSQILETCNEETRIALESYNNARETAKSNAKIGEDNLKLAQEELIKIETEVNSRDAKSIKNKYAVSLGQVFDENSTLNWEYITGETSLPYGVIAPDNVNPDEELPVLVFLHGSGEIGNRKGLERVVQENFMTDLENFRGYIICPQLMGGNWGNDNAMKQVGEILNSFSQDHNIDYDNIAMSGHSLGGIGVIHAIKNNRFEELTGIKLSKSVILSGYSERAISEVGTDTKIYVGGGGDGAAKWQMQENLVKTGAVDESDYYVLRNSSHGSLDQDAFNLDEDGNNRSDIFEWLFEDKDDDNGYYSNL